MDIAKIREQRNELAEIQKATKFLAKKFNGSKMYSTYALRLQRRAEILRLYEIILRQHNIMKKLYGGRK